nr:hypothetical protein [Rhizobium laguerreae]
MNAAEEPCEFLSRVRERHFLENMENMENMEIKPETIIMRQFTTGDLNKQIGDVTDVASREPRAGYSHPPQQATFRADEL